MTGWTGTGQLAMAIAIQLVGEGQREAGAWRWGSVPESPSHLTGRTWSGVMARCGVILDWAPDMAVDVLTGRVTITAANELAEARRKSMQGPLSPGPAPVAWPAGMKGCPRCRRVLDAENDFGRDADRHDGRTLHCRACRRTRRGAA